VLNNELQMIWRETDMAELRYDPHICLEGLEKTMKYLMIAGVPAEIRIEHPLNVGLKRECYVT
jgi:hypothetical protein